MKRDQLFKLFKMIEQHLANWIERMATTISSEIRNTLKLAILVLTPLLGSCHSENVVDSFEDYCQLGEGGNDVPFWALTYSVSFDEDAIRADYSDTLNKLYLEATSDEDKGQPMAWADDKKLHLINLSSITYVEPDVEINRWKNEIELAQRYQSKDSLDQCLYGAVAKFFDSLHIHSMDSDVFGSKWTDDVTVIVTDREAISALDTYDEIIDFLDKRKSAAD